MTKVCPTCKKELDIDCFSIDKSKKDGHTYQCKDCQKLYYKKQKEEKTKQAQQYPETKICYCCRKTLPYIAFNKRTISPDGLQAICKDCQKEKDNERKLKQKTTQNKTKLCSHCNKILDILEFNNSSYNSDGLQSMCRSCRKEYKKRCVTKEKYIHESGQKHCTKCGKYLPLSEFYVSVYDYDGYNSCCKSCCKNYYMRNRISIAERTKSYREQNKDVINAKDREKYKKNAVYRLNTVISSSIYHALKENKAEQHWENLVPYNLQQLKEHLESQFTPEMNWDNFGSYWEIDHIIPKGTFNYTKSDDLGFKICWSLANLRPLYWKDNRSRPKDGSDISESLKQSIFQQGLML
nr:endonuclease VII [uncultured phage]CAI9752318.1 endonuclease VII [uncultured phage]